MKTGIIEAKRQLWKQRRELYRSAIRPEGMSYPGLSPAFALADPEKGQRELLLTRVGYDGGYQITFPTVNLQ
jgi:hypothetical protein